MKGRQEFQKGRGAGDSDEVAAVARLLASKTSPWRLAEWGTKLRGVRPAVCASRRLIVGNGQQFRRIGDALREASNGDVIEIRSGTYREALRPSVDVELVAKGRVVVESKLEHALFVDGVGVGARGISWIGARKDRSAVAVRDGGVLRLERCTITSLSHGVTPYDESTIAFLSDVKIRDVGDLGISAWDHAWLRAERVEVSSPTRSGISSEKGSHVVLERCRVRSAGESGFLVIGGSSAIARDSSFEKSKWNNVQVSSGALQLSACTISRGGTGLLVQSGSVSIDGLEIDRTEGNGLELNDQTTLTASKVEITEAGGSAVFVAGGELVLARCHLEKPAFDGVTVMKGRARLDETEIVSPGRAAIWLEKGRGRAEAKKLQVRGGELGIRSEGGRIGLLDSEVRGVEKGCWVSDGHLELRGCLVRGDQNAIAATGKSELVVHGGALVGGSDVTVALDGKSRVSLEHVELVSGKQGEHRVAAASRWSASNCISRRATKFRPA